MACGREELFKLKNSTDARINGCKLDGRKFGPLGKGFIISSPWFSSHLKKGNTRTKQNKFQDRACQSYRRVDVGPSIVGHHTHNDSCSPLLLAS